MYKLRKEMAMMSIMMRRTLAIWTTIVHRSTSALSALPSSL
jgi:hypothetical protein